jgi:hypothetical protein
MNCFYRVCFGLDQYCTFDEIIIGIWTAQGYQRMIRGPHPKAGAKWTLRADLVGAGLGFGSPFAS